MGSCVDTAANGGSWNTKKSAFAFVAMCTISSQQVFLAMFSEATTIGCCASQWEVCIEAHGLVMFERRGQFMVGGLVVIWSVCLLFCCQRDFSACCVFFVVSLCF